MKTTHPSVASRTMTDHAVAATLAVTAILWLIIGLLVGAFLL